MRYAVPILLLALGAFIARYQFEPQIGNGESGSRDTRNGGMPCKSSLAGSWPPVAASSS